MVFVSLLVLICEKYIPEGKFEASNLTLCNPEFISLLTRVVIKFPIIS